MSTSSPSYIFIVDNGRVYVDLLQYIFAKDFGYRFVNYRTGKECLDNLYLNPEIIVLNNDLPDMNGLDVLKVIRKEHPHIFVPMIISESAEALPSQVFDAGADDYIIEEAMGDWEVKEKIEAYLQRENHQNLFSSKVKKLAMRKIYYVVLALIAISAGIYYYQ